jgi:DNA polymerase I-like protein with 3'-5' exonuclease and polymerase domains
MLKIAKRYKVVLTVHDAIGIVAREAEAEEARAYVESCMRWVPPWAEGLPVNCESGMGKSYGDC